VILAPPLPPGRPDKIGLGISVFGRSRARHSEDVLIEVAGSRQPTARGVRISTAWPEPSIHAASWRGMQELRLFYKKMLGDRAVKNVTSRFAYGGSSR